MIPEREGLWTFGDHVEPLHKDQLIFADPRKYENDLLQEDRFGPDEMAKLSMELI